MNISKLTITSIHKKGSSVVISNPTTDFATTMIQDRLNTKIGYGESNKINSLRKIPKFLKGIINPNYKTSVVKKSSEKQ